MATSSIFTQPQFTTEESVRSLVEAIEASEKDVEEFRGRMRNSKVREVTDPAEIRKIFGVE